MEHFDSFQPPEVVLKSITRGGGVGVDGIRSGSVTINVRVIDGTLDVNGISEVVANQSALTNQRSSVVAQDKKSILEINAPVDTFRRPSSWLDGLETANSASLPSPEGENIHTASKAHEISSKRNSNLGKKFIKSCLVGSKDTESSETEVGTSSRGSDFGLVKKDSNSCLHTRDRSNDVTKNEYRNDAGNDYLSIRMSDSPRGSDSGFEKKNSKSCLISNEGRKSVDSRIKMFCSVNTVAVLEDYKLPDQ